MRSIEIDENEYFLNFYVVQNNCVNIKLKIGEFIFIYIYNLFGRNGSSVRKVHSI